MAGFGVVPDSSRNNRGSPARNVLDSLLMGKLCIRLPPPAFSS